MPHVGVYLGAIDVYCVQAHVVDDDIYYIRGNAVDMGKHFFRGGEPVGSTADHILPPSRPKLRPKRYSRLDCAPAEFPALPV